MVNRLSIEIKNVHFTLIFILIRAIDRQPEKSLEQVFLRNGLKTSKNNVQSNIELLKSLPIDKFRYPDHSTWNPLTNYP